MKRLFYGIALSLFATSANAAIALDGTATAVQTSGIQLTWLQTVTSNTNGLLVVGVVARTASVAITSMTATKGGADTAMTLSSHHIDSAGRRGAIYYIKTPDTGSNRIRVNFGASAAARGTSSSYTGVDQTNTVDVSTGNAGTASAVNTFFTTTASNDLMVDMLFHEGSAVSSTNTAQIQLSANDEGVWNTGGSYKIEPNIGSSTMAWTNAASDVFIHLITAFKETAGAGPTRSRFMVVP